MDDKQWDKSKFTTEGFSKRVEKPWGYEILWANTPAYVGKLLHVNKGKRLSLQYHDQKMETNFLVSGKALLWLDNSEGEYVSIEMETGKGYTIAPYQKHRLEALEDSDFCEVSTPETGTTFRLEDDYARGDETDEVRKEPNRGWEK